MAKGIQKDGLYLSIKGIIEQSRNFAYKAINIAMIKANWDIGRLIVEDEQKGKLRAEYGKTILKDLSIKLTAEYGKGYNESNLRYMR